MLRLSVTEHVASDELRKGQREQKKVEGEKKRKTNGVGECECVGSVLRELPLPVC